MSIRVEQTTDEEYIKSVLLHPSIFNLMRDDSCPKEPEAMQDANIMSIPGFFLKALVGEVPVGLWWLIWKDNKVEAHTALLPSCRGRKAIEATRKAIDWVFDNTKAEAITSYAWSDSPAVAWFCRAVGMHATSTVPWPNTRNGVPVEITHYEIARPN